MLLVMLLVVVCHSAAPQRSAGFIGCSNSSRPNRYPPSVSNSVSLIGGVHSAPPNLSGGMQQQQQQAAPPDPKAAQWAAKNDWFGTDNVMTAAALAIDAELKGEGYDPEDQDFYKEINKRVKSAFPHKFGEDQNRVQETIATPAQVVSGGSRSSPTSSKKVKLSKEDVRLAQKWDIPLERYAAEKLKVDSSEGYTNIN